ncbi:hypothetical protein AB1Y20_021682 [Prymnesium parvum]|uniref:Amine oxidase domain-containing protein n=1 Tax=Prymnesium parvum TaxID=97485 RepID=A0AB34JMX2_PRYPA
MPSPRVLIVGAGCTGAFLSRALRRHAPATVIVVWDAAELPGGRMRTEYAQLGALLGKADSGAQYITQDERAAAEHAELYASLRAAGLLLPFSGAIVGSRAADGGGQNFICPDGMGALVQRTFDEAAVTLTCPRKAVRVSRRTGGGGVGWDVTSDDGAIEGFDAVVLTAPVPEQLLLLESSGLDGWIDGELRRRLAALQYSSRYAISLFFPPEVRSLFDANLQWTAKYVPKEEDDALVYICYDSAKRAQHDGVVSLMAHTSVPYGLHHLGAQTADDKVADDLLERLRRLLPWMPSPAQTSLHAWRLSQVRYPLELPSGQACLPLLPPQPGVESAPLVMAGDSFSPLGSRMDGCIQSGEAAAAALNDALYGRVASGGE